MVTLSRRHARIIREGNRFKIVDQSTNGTLVNGQLVPEAYLKDGDVITFSEGGPKISFLTPGQRPAAASGGTFGPGARCSATAVACVQRPSRTGAPQAPATPGTRAPCATGTHATR